MTRAPRTGPWARSFDRKFGADLVASLPDGPAVYLFKDGSDEVLYVGKAKNARRRLGSYRTASRRKAHRKMRAIVREAAALEVRAQPTEAEALAVENELIRTLAPPFNVDGKYAFLYPAIGLLRDGDGRTLLCFTTDTDAFDGHGFRWLGSFRSRGRAKEAFDALVDLLALLGHLEPTRSLAAYPRVRGSRLAALRRLDPALFLALEPFLAGTSRETLSLLSRALLEKPRARRDAPRVQALLGLLADFYERDLAPLHEALAAEGREGTFVPQDERDPLAIRHRERRSARR